MKEFFKTIIGKCILYMLLCVCFFALTYAFIWLISKDLFWCLEMLESSYGRTAFLQMMVFNLLGGYVLYINAID